MSDLFGPGPEPLTTPTQVAVWDFSGQTFISHIDCPGYKRVRVDYYGDLANLAVYEVEYLDEQKTHFNVVIVDGMPKRLDDWRIDLS